MTETILIRPFAVGDFADDLGSIVAAAREAAAKDFEIVVQQPTPMEAGKRGVIGRAILEVLGPAAGGYAFSKVADAIVARARAGWKARHKPNTWPRPHYVKFTGPDGQVWREEKVSDDPPGGGVSAE